MFPVPSPMLCIKRIRTLAGGHNLMRPPEGKFPITLLVDVGLNRYFNLNKTPPRPLSSGCRGPVPSFGCCPAPPRAPEAHRTTAGFPEPPRWGLLSLALSGAICLCARQESPRGGGAAGGGVVLKGAGCGNPLIGACGPSGSSYFLFGVQGQRPAALLHIAASSLGVCFPSTGCPLTRC